MFWQIKDTGSPHGKTLINLNKINSITEEKNEPSKLRVHLACGKEYRLDATCIDNPVLVDLEHLFMEIGTIHK